MEKLIGKTVPFTEKIIFLDVETANNKEKDICQIGAIICENGQIVNVIDEFVKPYGKFTKANVNFHGISPETVKNALNIKQIWEQRFAFYNDSYIICAHNAEFDLEALSNSLSAYKVQFDEIDYIDTIMLTQAAYPNLKSYRREYLCEYFNLQSIGKSHNALSDTCDCLNIFIKAFKKLGNVHDYINSYYPIPLIRRRERMTHDEKIAVAANDETDDDFAGKVFVYSGTFRKFPSRKDIDKAIMERGGKSVGNITGATNYLVIGNDYGETKLQHAKERQANGQNIKIIDEDTFYKMLESNAAISESDFAEAEKKVAEIVKQTETKKSIEEEIKSLQAQNKKLENFLKILWDCAYADDTDENEYEDYGLGFDNDEKTDIATIQDWFDENAVWLVDTKLHQAINRVIEDGEITLDESNIIDKLIYAYIDRNEDEIRNKEKLRSKI